MTDFINWLGQSDFPNWIPTMFAISALIRLLKHE